MRTAAVYVDVSNVSMNGGYGMRYDILREFASRGDTEVVRLNAYASYDPEKAKEDPSYKVSRSSYFRKLREFGYKVITKDVKWYKDDAGKLFGKANADLDLAVDVLMQTGHGDRILLVTGDGDFKRVVQTLQSRGSSVEIVAFENVSSELRREADLFMSGYLIPGLLPPVIAQGKPVEWGQSGSRVRGICSYHEDVKGFGFFRYLKRINGDLWKTNSRQEGSPYEAVFAHDTEIEKSGVNPKELLGRNYIFEFEVNETTKGLQATNVKLVTQYGTVGDY